MKHRALLRLDLQDKATARTALTALAPDDPGLVRLGTEGACLVVETEGASAMGLLRSLDDVLGCLRAIGIP